MASSYDIIVAGGGHNGLTTAAYLAKAGLSVCVLELQDKIGGGVSSIETEPGFWHDPCSTCHLSNQPNPLLKNDELGLKSKYGLEYIYPDHNASVIFPDNRAIRFYKSVDRTCEAIAQFSQHDADAYRRFYKWAEPLTELFNFAMFSPAAPYGTQASVFDSSDEGRELIHVSLSSSMDLVDQWFENEQVKIAITRFVAEGMISPFMQGTGLMLLLFIPVFHNYGGGIPKGGSGKLSSALENCITDNGGTIRVNAPVESFMLSGGKVTGVVLKDGEEVLAKKAVASNLHMKQMFPGMFPEGTQFPENFLHRVNRLKPSSFTAINNLLCLEESPKYTADEVDNSIWVELSSGSINEIRDWYHNLETGIPQSEYPLIICPTLFDPIRAPEGKHCLYFFHFQPYNLRDGGPEKWDSMGKVIYEKMLENIRRVTTNMGPENIIGEPYTMTPLDIVRKNPSMYEGDIIQLGFFANQLQSNRPMYDYHQSRMPFETLYLAGSCAHPGGAVTNAPGRISAMVIMEDLGIDFEKVIG